MLKILLNWMKRYSRGRSFVLIGGDADEQEEESRGETHRKDRLDCDGMNGGCDISWRFRRSTVDHPRNSMAGSDQR
ncbi:uncharacterized protein LOC143907178 [Temnothorax americanus]|uniref:uncharacterized protein LOC143907178 n=1 Tax=Temnothorax americanus TaxID=1964332 RepID=UPI004068909E